jgi:hypothetical protein
MKTKFLKTIERYFNGEMDKQEREQFESDLGSNPLLKKEFDECKAVYEAIGDKESLQLRRQLKEIARGFEKGEGRIGIRRVRNEWVWLAALLIISISIISIVYSLVNSPLTSQYLALRDNVRNTSSGTFRLDPVYDDMMRYRLRSSEFILECPRDSLVVEKRSDVLFRWTTSIEGPFILEILNRHGALVFSSADPISSPYTFSKNIPVGIYIVRIRTATQAVCYRLLYVV